MTVAIANEFDPEEPVIDAIRSGDRYAFEELVRRQSGWIRAVVFGVLGDPDLVEDVVQQVWTVVWTRIKELRDPKAWRPWLYRLARNAAVDAGRGVQRRRVRLQGFREEARSQRPSLAADVGLANEELHRQVLTEIQALPPLYREPFVLRHVNGWSYRQIAEAMCMPVDTVETRLVRARRFLREALREAVNQER